MQQKNLRKHKNTVYDHTLPDIKNNTVTEQLN